MGRIEELAIAGLTVAVFALLSGAWWVTVTHAF